MKLVGMLLLCAIFVCIKAQCGALENGTCYKVTTISIFPIFTFAIFPNSCAMYCRRVTSRLLQTPQLQVAVKGA
jgi:hypothetical protein